jgi:hypothetical protein
LHLWVEGDERCSWPSQDQWEGTCLDCELRELSALSS